MLARTLYMCGALAVALGLGCSRTSSLGDVEGGAGALEAPPREDLGEASGDMSDVEDAPDMSPDASPAFEPAPPLHERAVLMPRACEPGERLVIAAVGDILLHSRLQRQAIRLRRKGRFRSLWAGVEDLFAAADIVYANLEGPAARGVKEAGELADDPGFRFDGEVYSTWPRFNYHPYLIEDIAAAGIDVVSTANNHSLDRAGVGVDRTLAALDDAGVAYTGTRPRRHRREDVRDAWHVITEARGWRVAWVACTFSTNGLPDRKDQVLFCYENRRELLELVAELAASDDVDAVIVTPHWGWEYRHDPRRRERELGRQLIEAGAAAVIGGHPHVIQPWERWATEDGREGVILYSTGNFVSNMVNLAERASIMMLLGLTRAEDGEVFVHGVQYVPLWLHRDGPLRYVRDALRDDPDEEALLHISGLLGTYNELDPSRADLDEPLDLTPQCDPAWAAPLERHPHNGGLGGGCETDEGCAAAHPEARCDADAPQGLCALSCLGSCPRQRGRARAFCAQLEADADEGVCLPRCAGDAECRPGYTCEHREQVGNARRRRKVCVPATTPP